jgi:hypothetical protein
MKARNMAWNNSYWVHVAQFACCIHIQMWEYEDRLLNVLGHNVITLVLFVEMSIQWIWKFVRFDVLMAMTMKVTIFWMWCLLFWYKFLTFQSCLLGLLFNPEDGVSTFLLTSVHFYHTVWRYITKESTLQHESNLS